MIRMTLIKTIYCGVAVATLLTAVRCEAQNPPAAAPVTQPSDQRRSETLTNLATLPSVSSVSQPGYSLSLDATTTEKKGSVAAVFGNRDDTMSFSITAAGPLDESTGEATPVSLDGLANSASVKTGFHWFYWNSLPATPQQKRAFCQAHKNKDFCDDSDFANEPARRKEFLALHGADRDPVLVDIEGEIGRAAFKFLAPSDLSSQSESHNDYAVSVSIGRYTPPIGYYRISYEYQRAWENAGAPRQLCSPLVAPASTLECRTVVVGAPSQTGFQLARVELRHFFEGGRAAINPILTHDFESGVTAVAVPVYLFSNKNGGLAGGGRVSWRSDSRDLRFVIFVGAALKPIG